MNGDAEKLKFGEDSRFDGVTGPSVRPRPSIRRARIGHADAYLDKILRARSRFVQNLIGDILHHSARSGPAATPAGEEICFDDRHRKSIVRGTASE